MAVPAPLTADELRLIHKKGLTLGQIKWRREKHKELGELFKQEFPEDEVGCFLASTRGCFNSEALQRMATRIAMLPAPKRINVIKHRGNDIPIAPAELLVWQPPQEGHGYVIGADIGEGLARGDASAASVLDRVTCEQVAELHGRVAPERFAHQLNALGRWYREAMVAVERNNHGHSTLNTLRHTCRYPRLYHHVRYDHGKRTEPVLGWPTDQATKPILVDDLAAAIVQGALMINSAGLIDECMSFVTTDTGSQEAAEGRFDDRVIAVGIAWQARKRGAPRPTIARPADW